MRKIKNIVLSSVLALTLAMPVMGASFTLTCSSGGGNASTAEVKKTTTSSQAAITPKYSSSSAKANYEMTSRVRESNTGDPATDSEDFYPDGEDYEMDYNSTYSGSAGKGKYFFLRAQTDSRDSNKITITGT